MTGTGNFIGLWMKQAWRYVSLIWSCLLYTSPEITFVLDQSIEYGVTMSKKIDDVTKDLDTDGEEDAE